MTRKRVRPGKRWFRNTARARAKGIWIASDRTTIMTLWKTASVKILEPKARW